MRIKEPEDVYNALVAELAYTVAPTIVMGFTFLAIGSFAYAGLGSNILLVATIVGGLASLAKVCLMRLHLRWNQTGKPPELTTRHWELAHAGLTFLVASSVAGLAASIFRHSDFSLQILATALLFGYCAGVASRMSVRPLISITALSIAAIPTTISAAFSRDTAHALLATMFAVFMLAAMQSVWHVYRTASRQIQLRLEMERLARTDPLTGLANRIALQEAFATFPRKTGAMVAVHCLDLDGFKAVNDRLGHFAGDELLVTIGTRLRDLLGPGDVAARVGGDEFVILQTNISNASDVENTATAIFRALTGSFQIAGETVTVGVSLGYTALPSNQAEFGSMMRLADSASYRAKRRGGGIEGDVPPPFDVKSLLAEGQA